MLKKVSGGGVSGVTPSAPQGAHAAASSPAVAAAPALTPQMQARVANVDSAEQTPHPAAESHPKRARIRRTMSRSRRVMLAYLYNTAGDSPLSVSKHTLQECLQLSHNTVNEAVAELTRDGYILTHLAHDPVTGAQLASVYQLTEKGVAKARSF